MRRRLLALLCEVLVVWSFVYLALGRVLELIVLCCRSAQAKDIEILVLPHELAVLCRQHPRPRLQSKDRALLAALSRHLPRTRWSVFVVKPETLLGWHRRMLRRRWTYPTVSMGRPPVPDKVQQLIVRLARENPRWGYQRIRGDRFSIGRPPASWRATSLPSIRCSCNGCMCCSSSNCAAGGCAWLVSPPTRLVGGLPSRRAISSAIPATMPPRSTS